MAPGCISQPHTEIHGREVQDSKLGRHEVGNNGLAPIAVKVSPLAVGSTSNCAQKGTRPEVRTGEEVKMKLTTGKFHVANISVEFVLRQESLRREVERERRFI